jgi:hypothetical protein
VFLTLVINGAIKITNSGQASNLVGQGRANSPWEDPPYIVVGWLETPFQKIEGDWATWKRSIRAILDKGTGIKSPGTN